MLLMDSDLELDFEGHVSSYSLAIFYWVKWVMFKNIRVFVFIKSTFVRYFLMWISYPSPFYEYLGYVRLGYVIVLRRISDYGYITAPL